MAPFLFVMKIVIGIAYDGTNYSGWQRQADTEQTIQQKLESAIGYVADEEITLFCAGRTDAGVHATGQVAHYETDSIRSERSWIRGINTRLPNDISVHFASEVADSFHARYRATQRSYSYLIDNSPLAPSAVNRRRTSWTYEPLDISLMKKAAKYLLGEHDFSSFRASECQAKSPVKTIKRLDIERRGSYVMLYISADAFLHHMVRNIAGVLMAIGSGKEPVKWCKEVLQARDRTVGGVTASPHGLYLTGVQYPEEYNVPRTESEIILAS